MEMEKRATETQPRAGGGRREAGDEREQPRKTEKTEKGGRRDATSSTDGGGGGCSGGLQREQTNGPLLLQQKIKEARIRAEDGLQEMKTGWCRPRWAFWRHPFIGGEQMPAPGGTAVHTSSAKKGARPLASRSRGSETLCIFIASSNCIVNYHEKGFRVFVLSSEPYSLFHAVFHPHFPSIISTISTASPPLPQPPQTLAARSGRSPNFPKSSRLGNTLLARQRDTVAPLRLHTYSVSCAAICNPRYIPERQGP